MNLDTLSQVAIVVLGGGSTWVLSRKGEWRKWGYLLGLLSEPFWLYTMVVAKQWALLPLVGWYTYSWSCGVLNHLWKRKP